MLQRDIQKVTAATGGIEYANFAKVVMKQLKFITCLVGFSLLQPGFSGDLYGAPLFTQWVNNGWHYQTFDVGARGKMGTEFMALAGVKRPL